MNERNAVPPSESRYDAVDLVCVPRYEYARLIAAKAKLDIIEKCVLGLTLEDCGRLLDILLTPLAIGG